MNAKASFAAGTFVGEHLAEDLKSALLSVICRW
jgi:hypothetical protein